MADVERPTVLTVLAVLVLIGAAWSCIAALIGIPVTIGFFALGGVVAGLFLLLWTVSAIASAIVGIMGGVKIFGNKPKGVNFLRLYAYIGCAAAVLNQIGAVAMAGSSGFSVGGLIGGLIFPGICLALIFTQQPIKDYESQVG